MKHFATMALMLNLGVAGVCAQPGHVNMTMSGTTANSTISVQGTTAGEYDLAGNGALGQVTLRLMSTSSASPQPSLTCAGPTKAFFATVAGAGVFRSQNGDLLVVNLTGGSDCIDFAAGQALCTRILQIMSGTGHFKNASGTVTLTMTVTPVLADGPTKPVFFTAAGLLTGTVSGGTMEQELQDVLR